MARCGKNEGADSDRAELMMKDNYDRNEDDDAHEEMTAQPDDEEITMIQMKTTIHMKR